MLTPFSSEDLGRVFDSRMLTKGRTFMLLGAVEVRLVDPSILVEIELGEQRFSCTVTPAALDRNRVVFLSECSCKRPACEHMAAGALSALERFPALRKAKQASLLDSLSASAPAVAKPERKRLLFELSPGTPPAACELRALLVAEDGTEEPTTPGRILADPDSGEAARTLARLLGGGPAERSAVPGAAVTTVLGLLARLGRGRWRDTGQALRLGADRAFPADRAPDLPEGSAVIVGDAGAWYVDGSNGETGRIRVQAAPRAARAAAAPAAAPSPRSEAFAAQFAAAGRAAAGRPGARPGTKPGTRVVGKAAFKAPVARRAEPPPRPMRAAVEEEPVFMDHPPVPVLRLGQVECPDDGGRLVMMDALSVAFDYAGVVVPSDDERQFVRGGSGEFIRRDKEAEAAALELLRPRKFVQMRVADAAAGPKGRMVLLFRGRDAGELWQAFASEALPLLEELGWRNEIEKSFGPRHVERVGSYDVRVEDAQAGSFSLDFGIEIDGVRMPMLPILVRLLERGGMAAATVVDGEVVTSLEDGRLLRLPADRIGRLLTVMQDLVEAAQRTGGGQLVLPDGEAQTVLDLEELLPTRWENAGAVQAYAARFRDDAEIEPVVVPAAFQADLRPYQEHGVAWLQHLRREGMGAFLADDMGLGKTAQTVAHLVIEHAEGRLDVPALVVVPTSLVANWEAEIAKFAPHLRVVVLHGADRHGKRDGLDGVQVVITTYTVLTRDIEAMKALPWHLVVLDEAQVIKSPEAKATRAVCQLDARHRLCLSGTPIENNLGELWSEFAFLAPGLLGDRKGFTKRFRTPIEKNGDTVRRAQLARRVRPFLLRRTKHEVASDLPPKHVILRRIDLAPEQRELYETIRGTLHDEVREQLPGLSAAQGRIVVLDALLKLRQVCCDPRLVKLPSARTVEASSKLDDLMEMVGEMVPEGRRILLFSQFTSMLDLIKPRLDQAGIGFAELRGDTRDRGAAVERFESGSVPVFLISLKAGGRGLNLVSADTVIHYDPWWNPAAEDQASDRAHRIGQTKSVFVYKMVAADTVEDRIIDLQARKAELASLAFDGEDGGGRGLDEEDVAFLFGNAKKDLAA